MDMAQQEFKYFAFISYSSKDTEWGKRLQRKLESYHMPATLCSEHGWTRTPIKPVFFAPADIQPNYLSEELQERLRASRNLIVICSPNSAKSKWVGEEIAFFHNLGRTKQIHFFIIDGEPHSGNPETECFNPVVEILGLPEILGANIHERTQTFPFTKISWPWMDKQRAYVQLISKLLGVEFDAIWQRHKRLLIQKAVAWTIGMIAVVTALVGIWVANQPVDVQVTLDEVSVHNNNLPPLRDAVVTVTLDNETKTDTFPTPSDIVKFTNVPPRYLGREVRVEVIARDFLPLDTVIVLSKHITLGISRNPQIYGDVHFRIWDCRKEVFVSGVTIGMEGQTQTSDDEGWIHFFVPLALQRPTYQLTSSVPLERNKISMPCGSCEVVEVKAANGDKRDGELSASR